jgi:hypothetical protein
VRGSRTIASALLANRVDIKQTDSVFSGYCQLLLAAVVTPNRINQLSAELLVHSVTDSTLSSYLADTNYLALCIYLYR